VNYKSKWRSRRRIHTAFLLKLYFNNSIMDRLTWIKSLINAILFYGALKMAMSLKKKKKHKKLSCVLDCVLVSVGE